jgi:hypothetical protein
MVVLPVKVAGTWALYLTQRATKQQSVLRLAIRVRKLEATNSVALGAIYNLDRIMHSLGGSVMTIRLKTVVDCMKGHGTAVHLCRVKAVMDVEAN